MSFRQERSGPPGVQEGTDKLYLVGGAEGGLGTVDLKAQASQKFQSKLYVPVHFCFGRRDQKAVVELRIDCQSVQAKVGDDWCHAFGENAWCCGQAEWESLELVNDVVEGKLEVLAVMRLNGNVEIGVPEICYCEPVASLEERDDLLQRGLLEAPGRDKLV